MQLYHVSTNAAALNISCDVPCPAERHLHYWMGQQQRKLGHNELPRDQAEKLQQLLDATKGKKAGEGGGGGGRKAGTSSRRSSQGAAAASAAAADDDGDDNDEQE